MTTTPRTIRSDAQLAEAEAFMVEHKIQVLAVTDEVGALVGVVEIFD